MIDQQNELGIDPRLRRATAEVLCCPKCNSKFSLLYARTFACAGCPHAIKGCANVRCPRCDSEFPINSTPLGASGKSASMKVASMLDKYNRDFGVKRTR